MHVSERRGFNEVDRKASEEVKATGRRSGNSEVGVAAVLGRKV